jgi:hypothetical protein
MERGVMKEKRILTHARRSSIGSIVRRPAIQTWSLVRIVHHGWFRRSDSDGQGSCRKYRIAAELAMRFDKEEQKLD